MKKIINRVSELNDIKANIEKRPIFIQGEGGIGKTRILEEIRERYSQTYKVLFLDFDNYRELFLPYRIELTLAAQVDEKTNLGVQDSVAQLKQMTKRGDSQISLDEQRESIQKVLVDGFDTYRKVLLICDTVEKIDQEGTSVLESIVSILQKSSSLSSIFAGRCKINKTKVLVWDYLLKLPNNPLVLQLQPFDDNASREYLEWKEKQIHINISERQKESILLLTHGRPILLNLVVDFIAREINLKSLLEINFQTFKNLSEKEQNEYRRDFEKQLVLYLKRLKKPLDRFVILLAHIYPVSQEMLATLMGVSDEQAVDLFEEAKGLVFVKTLPGGSLTLHDEMRRMVREYVLKKIDPKRKERIEYSKIAKKIAKQRDEELRLRKKNLEFRLKKRETKLLLTNNKRQKLERELQQVEHQREIATEHWLFHSGFISPAIAFEELYDLVGRVRRGRKYSFANRVIAHANLWGSSPWSWDKENTLKPAQKERLSFLQARAKMDLKKFTAARTDFEKLTDSYIDQSLIFNLLGVIETHLGNLEQALKHEEKALSILWESNTVDDIPYMDIETLESIMYVSNWTGYVARLRDDDDRKYLELAEKHYEHAIQIGVFLLQTTELSSTKETEIRSLIASSLNNQGYAFGLQGELRKGRQRCKEAISIWTKLGQNIKISFGEISLGIMARDEGDYLGAISLFESAIRRLRDPDDAVYLCRAWYHLGWTRWFLAEKTSQIDMAVLKRARKELERALKYAEEREIKRELPGIYHQLASVLWSLGQIKKDKQLAQKARMLNQKSIEYGRDLNNLRYFIDAIVGQAEFDLDEGISSNLSTYQEDIKKYKQHESFSLYFGRLDRIWGEFALREGDITEIVKSYGAGLEKINLHGGYGHYSIERELQRFSRKLEKCRTISETKKILDGLGKYWKEGGIVGQVDLLDWYKQQSIHFSIIRSAKK